MFYYEGIPIESMEYRTVVEAIHTHFSILGGLLPREKRKYSTDSLYNSLSLLKRQNSLMYFTLNMKFPQFDSDIVQCCSAPIAPSKLYNIVPPSNNSFSQSFSATVTFCLNSPKIFGKCIADFYSKNQSSLPFFAFVTFPCIYSFFDLPFHQNSALECVLSTLDSPFGLIQQHLCASIFLNFPFFISTLWNSFFSPENKELETQVGSYEHFLSCLTIAAKRLLPTHSQIASTLFQKSSTDFTSTFLDLVFIPTLQSRLNGPCPPTLQKSGANLLATLAFLSSHKDSPSTSCIAQILSFSEHLPQELAEIDYLNAIDAKSYMIYLSLCEAKLLTSIANHPDLGGASALKFVSESFVQSLDRFVQFQCQIYIKNSETKGIPPMDLFPALSTQTMKERDTDIGRCWSRSCLCLFHVPPEKIRDRISGKIGLALDPNQPHNMKEAFIEFRRDCHKYVNASLASIESRAIFEKEKEESLEERDLLLFSFVRSFPSQHSEHTAFFREMVSNSQIHSKDDYLGRLGDQLYGIFTSAAASDVGKMVYSGLSDDLKNKIRRLRADSILCLKGRLSESLFQISDISSKIGAMLNGFPLGKEDFQTAFVALMEKVIDRASMNSFHELYLFAYRTFRDYDNKERTVVPSKPMKMWLFVHYVYESKIYTSLPVLKAHAGLLSPTLCFQ